MWRLYPQVATSCELTASRSAQPQPERLTAHMTSLFHAGWESQGANPLHWLEIILLDQAARILSNATPSRESPHVNCVVLGLNRIPYNTAFTN